MWAAVLNASRGASNAVLLTMLGGGAFGNEDDWILGAMRRALAAVSRFDLDVKVVSYRAPSPALLDLLKSFSRIEPPYVRLELTGKQYGDERRIIVQMGCTLITQFVII